MTNERCWREAKEVSERRYELSRILNMILNRVFGPRTKLGVNAGIFIQKMDVKSTFRQVVVDADGASHFAYRLVQSDFVEFRLQPAWRGNPG